AVRSAFANGPLRFEGDRLQGNRAVLRAGAAADFVFSAGDRSGSGRGIRAGVFRWLGKKDRRAGERAGRQSASLRFASVRKTSPWREDLDANVRYFTRGRGLFCAREVGVESGAGASALFRALKEQARDY